MRRWQAVLVMGFVACAPLSAAAQTFKLQGEPRVVYLFSTKKTANAWAESHENARLEVERQLSVTVDSIEDVPYDKDTLIRLVDEQIARGVNVIIGNAYPFGEGFSAAAQKHPNIAFLNISGDSHGPNLESAYGRSYEGFYVAGIAAGLQTQSGIVAAISPFPYSFLIWDQNAFARGVASVSPTTKILGMFSQTWEDDGKNREVAKGLLQKGADVLANATDYSGTATEAELAGKQVVGYGRGTERYAPKGHLASVVFHWENYLVPRIKGMMEGTWEPAKGLLVGMSEGVVAVEGLPHELPSETRSKIRAAIDGIRSGTLTPFDGPVVKQDGTLVAGPGVKLSDEQLWSMDYYVKEITGSIQ